MNTSKASVYVECNDGLTDRMLKTLGFKVVSRPKDASIILFTGGADVSPSLYGEATLPTTHNDPARDAREADVFAENIDKLKVGICRGGQFLNVMSGGRMWQDIGGHTRPHRMYDVKTGETFVVTSTHHQMMRPSLRAKVLAMAYESCWVKSDKELLTVAGTHKDIEVVWYGHTKSLCFQPHPELPGFPGCTKYFYDLVQEYAKQCS